MQRSHRRPWGSPCSLRNGGTAGMQRWRQAACARACVCAHTDQPSQAWNHTRQLGERLRARLQTQHHAFPHCTSQELTVGKSLRFPPLCLAQRPADCVMGAGKLLPKITLRAPWEARSSPTSTQQRHRAHPTSQQAKRLWRPWENNRRQNFPAAGSGGPSGCCAVCLWQGSSLWCPRGCGVVLAPALAAPHNDLALGMWLCLVKLES